MDHEFEMMATNLSSNFELTIRSSMTASFVVHGSFNIAFFSFLVIITIIQDFECIVALIVYSLA